jgi:hypothetical protein
MVPRMKEIITGLLRYYFFHMAVGSNNFKVVQALIDYSDLTIKDNRWCTPLDIAIYHGHNTIQAFIVNYEQSKNLNLIENNPINSGFLF